MSESSKQENHQSDGIDPSRAGSLKVTSGNQSTFFYHQQPSTKKQDTLYGDSHNEKLILENKGPQNIDEKPEDANFRDEEEKMMIIGAESKIRAAKTCSDDMIRSRQIHKKLQNQKLAWLPNVSELDYLKASFEANQNPSIAEKEELLKNLEQDLNTKANPNQLGRWFQNQRDKQSRDEGKDEKKSIYKKFTKEEIEYLQDCFSRNKYPKLEEMTEVALKLKSNVSKIENWYKHSRRSLAKRGLITLKNKKYFKKEELDYLQQNFALFPRPYKEKYNEIAKRLTCEVAHVKNWFSNRRKKIKQSANRAQSSLNMGAETNDKANYQIRGIGPPTQFYQTDPLIQNLPISRYKPADGLNRNLGGTVQPTNLVHSLYPERSPLQMITADSKRTLETTPYPFNSVYYVNSLPQFIPTSSNFPNGIYADPQPQFIPVNYNGQTIFTPYYIQPQGLPQTNFPLAYHIDTQSQFPGPQTESMASLEAHHNKKEFQIQNVQSVVMSNQNNFSGTSTGSTSGTSGKNASNHANKDATSSNTSKQDQDSKDNVSNSSSNSSKAYTRPNDQDNLGNESPQDEPIRKDKHPKLQKFESSDRVEEQTTRHDKGINRQNVFLEDKNPAASQPNQGRNLDLSREYKRDQSHTLTTELHSGSNVSGSNLPGNRTDVLPNPWKSAPVVMMTPTLTSNPNLQPLVNPPIQILAQNPVEFANPMGQLPYVMGVMYPYQNVIPNYYPTFQTRGIVYNPLVTSNPAQSELLQLNPIQLPEAPRNNDNT